MRLSTVELAPHYWPHVEALFGKTGACGGCWCQAWRIEESVPCFFVIRSYRGKGVAKAMLRRALEAIKEKGQKGAVGNDIVLRIRLRKM
jgi:GNAT superfamily N-acetyltransferase